MAPQSQLSQRATGVRLKGSSGREADKGSKLSLSRWHPGVSSFACPLSPSHRDWSECLLSGDRVSLNFQDQAEPGGFRGKNTGLTWPSPSLGFREKGL